MTARTKIDVHAGTLSMEFDDDVVHFNIFEAIRHPTEVHYVFLVDIIEDAVDSVDICTYLLSNFYDFDLSSFYCTYDDFDEFAIVCSICANISSTIHFDCDAGAGSDPPISLPPIINLPFLSSVQPPSLELKPLPEHLKYAYLDDAQKLPVIACRKTITLTPPFPSKTSSLSSILGSFRFNYLLDDTVHLLVRFHIHKNK